jgi:hypothetical protein
MGSKPSRPGRRAPRADPPPIPFHPERNSRLLACQPPLMDRIGRAEADERSQDLPHLPKFRPGMSYWTSPKTSPLAVRLGSHQPRRYFKQRRVLSFLSSCQGGECRSSSTAAAHPCPQFLKFGGHRSPRAGQRCLRSRLEHRDTPLRRVGHKRYRHHILLCRLPRNFWLIGASGTRRPPSFGFPCGRHGTGCSRPRRRSAMLLVTRRREVNAPPGAARRAAPRRR